MKIKNTPLYEPDKLQTDFMRKIERTAMKARIAAKRGEALSPYLQHITEYGAGIRKNIKVVETQFRNSLQHDIEVNNAILSIPEEDRINNAKDLLEPERLKKLDKVRVATLDKNIPLELKSRAYEEQQNRTDAEVEAMVDAQYNGVFPNKRFYNSRVGYACLLITFATVDWAFTRSAISNAGGFERLSAGILALVMGMVMTLCVHYFGVEWRNKNKKMMWGYGIAGISLSILTIILRTI